MRSRTGIAVIAVVGLLGALPGSPAGAATRPKLAVVQTRALDTASLPAPASTSATASDVAAAGPFCSDVTRAEQDRPDLHEGRLVHVLYVVPRGAPDEQLDTNGTLACSLLTQNVWMRAQSELEWRLDTAIVETASSSDPNARVETLDVTFVRSAQPAGALDSVQEVHTELMLRGFEDPDKRYLTYVASGSGAGVCGDAWYPTTHHLGEVDGQYAQVYLDSAAGCGARDFGTPATGGGLSEAIAQQELMHNDGMTPLGAPHSCTNAGGLPFGHLCTGPLWLLPDVDPEGRDVMFPYVWYPLRDKVLDRGNDDYFGHGLPLAALENSPYLQPANAWGKPFAEPRGQEGDNGAPPDEPSSAAPQGERTIDVAASRNRVRAGGRVTIAGSLAGDASCTADQDLVVRRRVLSGPSAPALRTKSSADGSFELVVRVRRSTRFVVTAPATPACGRAESRPVVVRAR